MQFIQVVAIMDEKKWKKERGGGEFQSRKKDDDDDDDDDDDAELFGYSRARESIGATNGARMNQQNKSDGHHHP